MLIFELLETFLSTYIALEVLMYIPNIELDNILSEIVVLDKLEVLKTIFLRKEIIYYPDVLYTAIDHQKISILQFFIKHYRSTNFPYYTRITVPFDVNFIRRAIKFSRKKVLDVFLDEAFNISSYIIPRAINISCSENNGDILVYILDKINPRKYMTLYIHADYLCHKYKTYKTLEDLSEYNARRSIHINIIEEFNMIGFL